MYIRPREDTHTRKKHQGTCPDCHSDWPVFAESLTCAPLGRGQVSTNAVHAPYIAKTLRKHRNGRAQCRLGSQAGQHKGAHRSVPLSVAVRPALIRESHYLHLDGVQNTRGVTTHGAEICVVVCVSLSPGLLLQPNVMQRDGPCGAAQRSGGILTPSGGPAAQVQDHGMDHT